MTPLPDQSAVVHLSSGPRLGHAWCDRPSPRAVTGNPSKATCAECLLAADYKES